MKKTVFVFSAFILAAVLAAVVDVASKKMVFDMLQCSVTDKGIVYKDGRVVQHINVNIPSDFRPHFTIIKGFFEIVPVLNRGGMWGFLFGKTFALILFSGACIGIIGIMAIKVKERKFATRVALALILGGALGNLYDRLAMGGVRDFLDFDLGFIHWATFNLADVWIVLGVMLIFALEFVFPKKKRESEDAH